MNIKGVRKLIAFILATGLVALNGVPVAKALIILFLFAVFVGANITAKDKFSITNKKK